MTYLNSGRKKNKFKKVIIILLIVIIFVLINLIPILFPQSLFSFTKGPIAYSQNLTSTVFKNIQTLFLSKKELIKENESLRNGIIERDVQILQDMVRFEEYDYLEEEIQKSPTGHNFRVLSRPPFSPYDTLILKNKKDFDIQKDTEVYAQGALIGTVSDVENNVSTVTLFSSAGKINNVRINNFDTEAKGMGSGRYEITVPKDIEIKEGWPITMPFYNNALMGAVIYVESHNSDAFKTVHFSVPVSLQNILFVTVPK